MRDAFDIPSRAASFLREKFYFCTSCNYLFASLHVQYNISYLVQNESHFHYHYLHQNRVFVDLDWCL